MIIVIGNVDCSDFVW